VAREGSSKRASKLIADGFIPLHEQTGNLQDHIVSVVRHDVIQVRSRPCVVVLVDKRFDVKSRLDCGRSQLRFLLRSRYFTPLGSEPEFQLRSLWMAVLWPSTTRRHRTIGYLVLLGIGRLATAKVPEAC